MAHLPLELLGRACIHVCCDRTRVDSIDSSSFSKLSCPSASHGFQRRFGAAVDALPLESERGADTADVDNAAGAVVRQVRGGRFHKEERAAHVDVVERGEVVAVAFFHCQIAGQSSVVDNDIDLQLATLRVREVVLGHLYKVGRAGFGAHVCLHGQAFDAVGFLQALGELLCFVGRRVGSVVDHEAGAFAG